VERAPGYEPEVDRQMQCRNPELFPIDTTQRQRQALNLGRQAVRGAAQRDTQRDQQVPELGRLALDGTGLQPIQPPVRRQPKQPERDRQR
jgi:hypothetical protein